jgi:hypothetical protein
MRNKDANERKKNDLPTYLRPWGPEDHVLDDVR